MEYYRHVLTTYQFNNKIHLGQKGNYGGVIGLCNPKYDCYIALGVWNDEKFTSDFLEKYDVKIPSRFLLNVVDDTEEPLPTISSIDISSVIYKNIQLSKEKNLGIILNSFTDAFVRVDIECKEYDWIHSLDTYHLEHIKQLYIEIHDYNDKSFNDVDYFYRLRCLEKLNQTHYLIHVHANNSAPMFLGYMPDTLQLTYVRKDEYNSIMNTHNIPLYNITPLPTEGLDYPCNEEIYEFKLNFPPFYNLPQIN